MKTARVFEKPFGLLFVILHVTTKIHILRMVRLLQKRLDDRDSTQQLLSCLVVLILVRHLHFFLRFLAVMVEDQSAAAVLLGMLMAAVPFIAITIFNLMFQAQFQALITITQDLLIQHYWRIQ